MITYEMRQDFPINGVDINSDEFCFDYPGSTISDEGAVPTFSHPPILYAHENWYVPIWGKNILIQQAQQDKTLPCVLLVEGFQSIEEAVLYSIDMKAQTGGFAVIEKSLALKRLHSISDTWKDSVYKLLRIPRNNTIIQCYLSLADAPPAVKETVHSGILHENTAFEILRFADVERECTAEFIVKVALGTKKRNEILIMLRDIARRDNVKVKSLIESGPVQAILHETGMDQSHKGQRLYNHIRELRYPSICAFREKFNRKLREVNLDRRFQLQLPDNFEKWEFRLIVPFSSQEEFQDSVEKLKKTGEKSSFKELMNMRY